MAPCSSLSCSMRTSSKRWLTKMTPLNSINLSNSKSSMSSISYPLSESIWTCKVNYCARVSSSSTSSLIQKSLKSSTAKFYRIYSSSNGTCLEEDCTPLVALCISSIWVRLWLTSTWSTLRASAPKTNNFTPCFWELVFHTQLLTIPFRWSSLEASIGKTSGITLISSSSGRVSWVLVSRTSWVHSISGQEPWWLFLYSCSS